MDYTTWGYRELVEELQKRDREHPELLVKCGGCGEKMYGVVRVHHHTEIVDGHEQDVTANKK